LKDITEKIILKLSNPTSFENGRKYYLQGRVTDYYEDDRIIDANVIGGNLYKVKVWKEDLSSECNCADYKEFELCKHLVAVLLTKSKGEIIPKNKPTIKNNNSSSEHNKDQQFKSSLFKIPREKLIDDVAELGRTYPDIEEYFINKYSGQTSDYYNGLERKIRKKINSILSYQGNKDFPSKVFTASREVNSLIQNLPISRNTADFLLGTGYWISEKLAHIDDSNGYLSNLINEIIEKASLYLEDARPDDLVLYYKYTSNSSGFGFNINVIKSILLNIKNPLIIEAIMTKLEKSIFKKDPDFGFAPESGWILMMGYLKNNNPVKYEEFIPELMEKSDSIKVDHINYLFEKGKYEDVIRLYSDQPDKKEIEKAFENSLLALNNKQLLIEYYTKKLSERFDLNIFKHFSEIEGMQKMPEWKRTVEGILADNKYIFYRAEILLYLKRYDEFLEFISYKGQEYYRNNSVIEKLAIRFSLTNPSIAIRLFHYLIEKEIERMQKSNRYVILIDYFNELKGLNDNEYIEELKAKLKNDNPTKIKLIETLNKI
jgi:hypothetical protein